MFVLKPLSRPPVAALWAGQVLSATGDEFYRIALIWIAAGLIGSAAGWVSAAQHLASLAFSLAGGMVVDRWEGRRTLAGTELLRAAIALIIPALALAGMLALWQIFAVAVGVTGLRALSTCALQTILPRLSQSAAERHAINGLLDGVRRLARIAGPGLIGAAAALLPVPHLLTLAAASFAVSALSMAALADSGTGRAPAGTVGLRRRALQLAVTARAVWRHKLMRWSLGGLAITNTAWVITFNLGLVLHVQQTMPGEIGALGAVLAAYGVGNIAINVLVSSLVIKRFGLTMFGGRLLYGIGMLLMGLAPDLPSLMAAAFLASFGGPMNDVPFLALMQRDFRVSQLGRVYSVRICLDAIGLLVGAAIAVVLLERVPVMTAIAGAGVFVIAVSLVGLWRVGMVQSR
jgi:MFS family permease